MKRLENLGFAFMAVGTAAIVLAIWLIPIQVSVTHPVATKVAITKVDLVKVQKITPQEQVLIAAFHYGWLGAQWTCLNTLITIENPGWNPQSRNPNSTASGIFQVLQSVSGRLFMNYSTADQARLGTKYISARYGNPCRALTFHFQHGYF